MTTTQIRKVRINYESFGPHHDSLSSIAENLSAGVHHCTQSGETDQEFLGRVADEVRREFLRSAGPATGADGFSFSCNFAD